MWKNWGLARVGWVQLTGKRPSQATATYIGGSGMAWSLRGAVMSCTPGNKGNV